MQFQLSFTEKLYFYFHSLIDLWKHFSAFIFLSKKLIFLVLSCFLFPHTDSFSCQFYIFLVLFLSAQMKIDFPARAMYPSFWVARRISIDYQNRSWKRQFVVVFIRKHFLSVRWMCLAAHQWTIRALTPRSSFSLITINSFNLPKLISHPKINNDFVYTRLRSFDAGAGQARMSRKCFKLFFSRTSTTVCVGISSSLLKISTGKSSVLRKTHRRYEFQ